ncbi:MAG: hypothetical protein AAF703_22680 [Cyanobacteria bacterium P01_D01_bin.105]
MIRNFVKYLNFLVSLAVVSGQVAIAHARMEKVQPQSKIREFLGFPTLFLLPLLTTYD